MLYKDAKRAFEWNYLEEVNNNLKVCTFWYIFISYSNSVIRNGFLRASICDICEKYLNINNAK